jgi:DNA-binding NarL/FixJ family response regulator
MKKGIQILLVDDHQVVRDGLQHMLGQEEDMTVVGQSANGKEAISQLDNLSPNIILMDIKMPGENGIELTRRLLEKQPSCKVIMLTLYDEYVADAMEAGAVGYLLKDIKRTELTQAIRRVHCGQTVISESIKANRGYYDAKGTYKQEEGGSPTSYDVLSPLLEEVQMVIPPPVDADQLMRFVSRVEEMLQSHMLQMIGSWQGGTAITIPIPKPAPLSDLVNKLEELPEVGTIRESSLAKETEERLFKKADRLKKTLLVTFKNG